MNNPQQEQLLKQVASVLAKGTKPEDIFKALVDKGVPQQQAKDLVSKGMQYSKGELPKAQFGEETYAPKAISKQEERENNWEDNYFKSMSERGVANIADDTGYANTNSDFQKSEYINPDLTANKSLKGQRDAQADLKSMQDELAYQKEYTWDDFENARNPETRSTEEMEEDMEPELEEMMESEVDEDLEQAEAYDKEHGLNKDLREQKNKDLRLDPTRMPAAPMNSPFGNKKMNTNNVSKTNINTNSNQGAKSVNTAGSSSVQTAQKSGAGMQDTAGNNAGGTEVNVPNTSSIDIAGGNGAAYMYGANNGISNSAMEGSSFDNRVTKDMKVDPQQSSADMSDEGPNQEGVDITDKTGDLGNGSGEKESSFSIGSGGGGGENGESITAMLERTADYLQDRKDTKNENRRRGSTFGNTMSESGFNSDMADAMAYGMFGRDGGEKNNKLQNFLSMAQGGGVFSEAILSKEEIEAIEQMGGEVEIIEEIE